MSHLNPKMTAARLAANIAVCFSAVVLLACFVWLVCGYACFRSMSHPKGTRRPYVLAQPTIGGRIYSVSFEQYDPADYAGLPVSHLGPPTATRALVVGSIPVKHPSRSYVLAVPVP